MNAVPNLLVKVNNPLNDIADCFTQHARPLWLYARQWLDDTAAEDAVQEAFVRLAGQARMPDLPQHWLYRTVRNECISRLRRRKVNRKAMDRLAMGHRNWFESNLDDRLDAQYVQELLESLPEASREAVTLRLWGQLGFREIAGITGQPVSTVHRAYQTALDHLKAKMENSSWNPSVNLKNR